MVVSDGRHVGRRLNQRRRTPRAVAESAEHRFMEAHREGEESSATVGLYTQTLTVRDSMTLYAEEGFEVVTEEVEEKTVYTEVHIADELNFGVRSEWK